MLENVCANQVVPKTETTEVFEGVTFRFTDKDLGDNTPFTKKQLRDAIAKKEESKDEPIEDWQRA